MIVKDLPPTCIQCLSYSLSSIFLLPTNTLYLFSSLALKQISNYICLALISHFIQAQNIVSEQEGGHVLLCEAWAQDGVLFHSSAFVIQLWLCHCSASKVSQASSQGCFFGTRRQEGARWRGDRGRCSSHGLSSASSQASHPQREGLIIYIKHHILSYVSDKKKKKYCHMHSPFWWL